MRFNHYGIVTIMNASEEDVEAIILETDGNFSIIKKSERGSDSALSNVRGLGED